MWIFVSRAIIIILGKKIKHLLRIYSIYIYIYIWSKKQVVCNISGKLTCVRIENWIKCLTLYAVIQIIRLWLIAVLYMQKYVWFTIMSIYFFYYFFLTLLSVLYAVNSSVDDDVFISGLLFPFSLCEIYPIPYYNTTEKYVVFRKRSFYLTVNNYLAGIWYIYYTYKDNILYTYRL